MAEEKDPVSRLLDRIDADNKEVEQSTTEETAAESEEKSDASSEESKEQEEAQETTEDKPEESEKTTEDKPDDTPEFDEESLVAKAEAGDDLSDEEIKFLQEQGHEIELNEEEASEGSAEEEKPKEQTVEEPPAYAELLQEYYPEEEFTDRSSFESKMLEHLESERAANDQLVKVFNENPSWLSAIQDMQNGMTEVEALANNFDLEALRESGVPEPGTPEYRQFILDEEKKKEAKQAESRRIEQKNVNIQNAAKKMVEFTKNKGMNQRQQAQFFTEVDDFIERVNNGEVGSDELLETIYKSLNYDKDLKVAEQVGETRGVNKKIKAFKRKKVKTDGIPKPQVKATEEKSKKPETVVKDGVDKIIDKLLSN